MGLMEMLLGRTALMGRVMDLQMGHTDRMVSIMRMEIARTLSIMDLAMGLVVHMARMVTVIGLQVAVMVLAVQVMGLVAGLIHICSWDSFQVSLKVKAV